jgi:hypothetical protein
VIGQRGQILNSRWEKPTGVGGRDAAARMLLNHQVRGNFAVFLGDVSQSVRNISLRHREP